MTHPRLAIVVLAAGKGLRMTSSRAKVLHEVAGRSMLDHVLAAVAPLDAESVVVVAGPGMDDVADAAAPNPTVVQEQPLGTGHAVLAARSALVESLGPTLDGHVLVLFGDTPLITTETLERMLQAKRATDAPPVIALGFEADDPGSYGRMVLDPESKRLEAVVEAVDADLATQAITLCNGGLLIADADALFALLDKVGNENRKGEYYLTDVFGLAATAGTPAQVVEGFEDEIRGVNSRSELAAAEAAMQNRLRQHALKKGVTLVDPGSVWFSADTELAGDVVVEPHVIFGLGVSVASGARIRAFSHLENATIGADASVGPYARLRGGAVLEDSARVGNFVEVKNATLGAGAKAMHLTYLGDSDVGSKANIGAGTITCNYDGFAKHRTTIGAGAFIGSNAALVAPVTVGERAIVGAGSTITRDVPTDALAVARGRQETKPGFAARLRERLRRAIKKKD